MFDSEILKESVLDDVADAVLEIELLCVSVELALPVSLTVRETVAESESVLEAVMLTLDVSDPVGLIVPLRLAVSVAETLLVPVTDIEALAEPLRLRVTDSLPVTERVSVAVSSTQNSHTKALRTSHDEASHFPVDPDRNRQSAPISPEGCSGSKLWYVLLDAGKKTLSFISCSPHTHLPSSFKSDP